MVIPVTMISAAVFLRSKFESFQIWGSLFIMMGAIVASSDYLLQTVFGGADDTSHDPTVTGVSAAMASAAVTLYFISVVPSAFSNIYKESKMKEQDMNEVHTSTIVAFWQLWFGFLFLPLMSLPALGKQVSVLTRV